MFNARSQLAAPWIPFTKGMDCRYLDDCGDCSHAEKGGEAVRHQRGMSVIPTSAQCANRILDFKVLLSNRAHNCEIMRRDGIFRSLRR